MKILVRRTVLFYAKKYPKASDALHIWFGTHQEYDQIDASTVSFDLRIL